MVYGAMGRKLKWKLRLDSSCRQILHGVVSGVQARRIVEDKRELQIQPNDTNACNGESQKHLVVVLRKDLVVSCRIENISNSKSEVATSKSLDAKRNFLLHHAPRLSLLPKKTL